MTCANCHATVPPGSAFCHNCGTRAGAPENPPPAHHTYSGLGTVAPMREARGTALSPGTVFAGRYEVLRTIGAGGMGVVYLTRDTSTGGEVVLKLIHPDLAGEDAVARLMAEGVTARQIRHPNIVAVYDVAQWEGQPYFTMEHVTGGSLRSWLVTANRTGAAVPLATAAGIVKAILAGLGEAHRMHVVHRDLKPENVLLAADPASGAFDLKILDFGIARAIGGPLTTGRTAGPVGTQHYMAPEQVTSPDAAGPQADVYSVTVMLYELLVGVLPQARYEAVSDLRPEIPKAIDGVILKGLTALPKGRYASAAEYSAALDAVLQSAAPRPVPGPEPRPPLVPDPPPQPPPPPVTGNWWSRLSIAGKAGVVGSVLVVAAIVDAVNPDGDPHRDQNVVVPGPVEPGPNTGGNDGPPDPTPTPTPTPAPAPPPAGPLLQSGYWSDDFGNRFDVQSDGTSFAATGAIPNLGPVAIRGRATAQGAGFSIYNAVNGAELLRGEGMVRADRRHLDYVLRAANGATQRPATLHFNHVEQR